METVNKRLIQPRGPLTYPRRGMAGAVRTRLDRSGSSFSRRVSVPFVGHLYAVEGDVFTQVLGGRAITLFRRFALAAGVLAPVLSDPAVATTSGARRSRVDTIIVHAISGPNTSCPGGRLQFSGAPGDADRWKGFFDRHPFLGIHYVVDRDGRVRASTEEMRVANHALNNSATSVGIELVHDGDGREPFGRPQIAALIDLLRQIKDRHGVAIENIKGHMDVDTRTFQCAGRSYKTKLDPGPNFPWIEVLAELSAPPLPRLIAEPRMVMRQRPAR